jgi:hypothetical protein
MQACCRRDARLTNYTYPDPHSCRLRSLVPLQLLALAQQRITHLHDLCNLDLLICHLLPRLCTGTAAAAAAGMVSAVTYCVQGLHIVHLQAGRGFKALPWAAAVLCQ